MRELEIDPRSPYPDGWFHVTPSNALAPGEVLEKNFLGAPIVAFRTESGEAVVASAYCPHLGANLARGGRVVGESIRCPFHGLHWGPDGRCRPGGSAEGGATESRLPILPSVELAGFVFAWHHHADAPPAWSLPDLDTRGWTDPRVHHGQMATHVESIIENGVDTAHFESVHGFELSGGKFEDRGVCFHSEFHFGCPNYFGEGPDAITTFFDTDNYGLGCSLSLNRCEELGLLYRVFILVTPTSVDCIEYALGTSLKIPEPGESPLTRPVSEIAEIVHRGAVAGLLQDQPIWEGMRYNPKPRLLSSDGPIPQFRAFARRFYPDPAPETDPH